MEGGSKAREGREGAGKAQRGHRVLAMLSLSIVLVALAAVLVYPYAADYYTSVRETERMEALLSAYDERNAQIQSQIDYLNTDAGIEDQARSLGMVMEGENAVSVSGTSDESAHTKLPESVDSSQIKAPDKALTNILDKFFGYDG